MLKTSEKKPPSEMVLFPKPRETVRNCQLPQDERRYNLHEKEA